MPGYSFESSPSGSICGNIRLARAQMNFTVLTSDRNLRIFELMQQNFYLRTTHVLAQTENYDSGRRNVPALVGQV